MTTTPESVRVQCEVCDEYTRNSFSSAQSCLKCHKAIARIEANTGRRPAHELTEHSVLCLVGMVETGEIAACHLEAVGRDLAAVVRNRLEAIARGPNA